MRFDVGVYCPGFVHDGIPQTNTMRIPRLDGVMLHRYKRVLAIPVRDLVRYWDGFNKYDGYIPTIELTLPSCDSYLRSSFGTGC